MQNILKEEFVINKLNSSKTQTPKKSLHEDLITGKSPINKTPRSVSKLNIKNNISNGVKTFNSLNIKTTKDDKLFHSLRTRKIENEIKISQNKNEKHKLFEHDINPAGDSNLESKPKHLPPKSNLFQEILSSNNNKDLTLTVTATDNLDNEDEGSLKRKKKDWRCWSSQEKELFYEAIANGGNYSSLQKLFRNMNDVNYYFFNFLENRN